MPERYNIDYAGESRQLERATGESSGTFAFAIIIVFLALAAQFEASAIL